MLQEMELRETASVPIPELSGLAYNAEHGRFYGHADSGNKAVVYTLDEELKVVDTWESPLQHKKHDWEDITHVPPLHQLAVVDAGNWLLHIDLDEAGLPARPEELSVSSLYEMAGHDCESLEYVSTSDGGFLYLVSKARKTKFLSLGLATDTGRWEHSAWDEIKLPKKKHMASGMANRGEDLLILCHRGKHLYRYTTDLSYTGDFCVLDEDVFEQPEAVAFGPDSTLLVGSECGSGKDSLIGIFDLPDE